MYLMTMYLKQHIELSKYMDFKFLYFDNNLL